ncbi:hypothetical protein [Caulobacter mirabilis]|uniref:Uncharacterized protein n=1 Tax=Caulobacter mirabilis TaxID=69666 RepID=A0A2D2ASX3_9CAUL|nr:hypothetical protein [Caulobacter mirabilis]ATQ41065.1 hypothetical protein CSW64_00900 [Caulobacter mirabilis]
MATTGLLQVKHRPEAGVAALSVMADVPLPAASGSAPDLQARGRHTTSTNMRFLLIPADA